MAYNATAVQRSRDADLYAHLAEVDNMVETKCDFCKKEGAIIASQWKRPGMWKRIERNI